MLSISAPTPWVLQRLPQQKYVLHGSFRRLSVIEPRQAMCRTGYPDNNLFAVYATQLIHVAIVHAVIGRNTGYWRFTWRINQNNAKFCVRARNVHYRTGYIHVLPVEEFKITRGGIFCLSEKPVRAVKVYEIRPQILNLLCGLELDIDLERP